VETPKPLPVLLTILAYVVTTFAVQGSSHFAVNADHYASMAILRADPIIPMGLASMVIQGAIFAVLFPRCTPRPATVRAGLVFSWALGAFLASYIVLGESGKYAIPSIRSWVVVEASAAAVQFTVFGLLLGLIHRRAA
jgi:hypothetical protein